MNPAYLLPSSLSPIANHLWQSTLFAGIAWLLTLALRKNPARVSHGLWLAASLKFLVPISLLVALGSNIEWRKAPAITSNVSVVMGEVSQPFTAPVSSPLLATVPPARSALPGVFLGLWACGFIGISCAWWIRWWRIRAAMRAASPLHLGLPIEAMSSPTLMEPGIFGVFRPVLMLPEGITEHLTPPQLKAVIAHELYHVRHRDNLIAAVHMFVETVFWFHPLVWWIGKRMVEERERACDEQVLRDLGEPRAYAEGILNICKLYVESPLTCVSGVTGGANLKKRIEVIMKNENVARLNVGKKLALAVAGTVALAVPIGIGVINASVLLAQSPQVSAFEVASVRVLQGGPPDSFFLGLRRSGGRISWTTNLGLLLRYAYNLPDWRIVRTDKDQSFYAIDATMDTSATEDQVRLMLQTLLADRFKLVSHREAREVQGYALVLAKNGPRIKSSLPGEVHPMPEYAAGKPPDPFEGRVFVSMEGKGTSALTGRGVSTAQLAETLSATLGTLVLDQTGMTGNYYFGFKFLSVQNNPSDEVEGSTIFSALQDELGLRLEKQKGPIEVLIIDHVERPSEN
jgi:bla regulator protein blaR1